MHKLPLLEEHPLPLQIFLAGVVPLAFGALTGYLWLRDAWTAPELSALVSSGARAAAERMRDGWIWLPPMPSRSDELEAEPTAAAG